MPKVEFTEGKIAAIEGFAVRFRYSTPGKGTGRDVRSDKQHVPTYPFKRKSPGSRTVADWIELRCNTTFPGYKVEVLDVTGKKVHGGTLLSTVRATYLD